MILLLLFKMFSYEGMKKKLKKYKAFHKRFQTIQSKGIQCIIYDNNECCVKMIRRRI